MKSVQELKDLQQNARARLGLDGADAGTRVIVGLATCGIAAGANPVYAAALEAAEGMDSVTVSRVGCVGLCQLEPIAEVFVPGEPRVTYVKMTADRMTRVMIEHVAGGRVIEEYTVGAAGKEG